MNKEAAVKKLFSDVYLPAFVKRAAQHGIHPDSDESLEQLLKIAKTLKQAGVRASATKQAQILKQASDRLEQVLAAKPQKAQVTDDLRSALAAIKV